MFFISVNLEAPVDLYSHCLSYNEMEQHKLHSHFYEISGFDSSHS
ncbi:hypothetical protein SLEP1_g13232 [Rubroshorea leprosula]|uniref:Uncharacterized protein n=1 Tax=Rubroshorea leprosula TaxID=152421 RepID=A0AAV5IRK3_9ROSI|nr:hypothetical protein SLEP1_g13232 [Rubroshorea leprosula]